ncbi:Integrase [Vibrio crassostreae]|nr:Integrase [Vibrio crassostreae]CAK3126362.1 Integrase [Vibrio crassostreae]
MLKENTSFTYKRAQFSSAKRFLVKLRCNVASATTEHTQSTIDNLKYAAPLSSFFSWLHKHKLLSASCNPRFPKPQNVMRIKSGEEALNAEHKKLPDEKTLFALGAIFHDVIPPYDSKLPNSEVWQDSIDPMKSQLDTFVCTMFALAISSPSRIAAEQVLLTKQRLQSYTETVDGELKTVYYLNWRGSKGYIDNQKHFNAEMAESLDRALHYTGIVTEPAKVLARFYKNPTKPLRSLLGDFKPTIENLKSLDPVMDNPINIIHLALLLGFYDGTDKMVRVTLDTLGAIQVENPKGQLKYIKPIAELSPLDKLQLVSNCSHSNTLFGIIFNEKGKFRKYSAGKRVISILELQNHLIATNKANLSGYNKKQTKYVEYEQALFTFTEKQISTQTSSHFLLVPIASLEVCFSKNLKKYKGITYKTIFDRHGFSPDFCITPHQFRHWQNNLLAIKGLHHLLITILSGRKSAEQTLTYIHTTDDQNASFISDILYKQDIEQRVEEKISKRLQGKIQYDAAVDNLSPTFVTEVGFCVQNLTLSPCTYMTEFETQCTLCSSSCHLAHDRETIKLLEKDLQVQTNKLKQVQEAINFSSSAGMQKWYKTHYRNISMIKTLIEVLSEPSIKEGSIVRYLVNSNTMRITDLDTKTVTERKITLPNMKTALHAAIEATSQTVEDFAKNNFLGFLKDI